jgi:hypothetical protein
MNNLIIFLIFLIIILSFYLFYKNYQEYNILEKFSTQSSLSTYSQNTVDSDDYQSYSNIFNGTNQSMTNIIKSVGWNGLWIDRDNQINSQFLQVNDKLIVILSNYNLTNVVNNMLETNTSNGIEIDTCTNLFIGIANLNNTRTIFRITNVICDSYINNILNIGNGINNDGENIYFTGQLNTGITPTITLYPVSSESTAFITLQLNQSFTGYTNKNYPYLSPYIQQIAPFLQENPDLPYNSKNKSTSLNSYEYFDETCPSNTKPCNDINSGYRTLSYQIGNTGRYNACCNTDNTTNCFFNIAYQANGEVASIPQCPNNINVNYYQNYDAQFYLIGSNGNSLNVCQSLNYFTNTSGQVAILCYITNLTNVQTLNYQFFGNKPSDSSLTVQYDSMNKSLTNSLNNYKNNIMNQSDNSCPTTLTSSIENAYSFTNCFENSSSNTISNILNDCCSSVQPYITSNTLPVKINNNLLPTVWEINSDQTYNLLNSCPFTLNTSKLYSSHTTSPKYVQCNEDGTINLSLNGNGNNQNLYMENTTIINEGTNQNNYYAITTNIRSNNGLYLVPSNNLGGFYNNSTQVSLVDKPEPNGKWLILGFTLSTLSQLNSIINNYTF